MNRSTVQANRGRPVDSRWRVCGRALAGNRKLPYACPRGSPGVVLTGPRARSSSWPRSARDTPLPSLYQPTTSYSVATMSTSAYRITMCSSLISSGVLIN